MTSCAIIAYSQLPWGIGTHLSVDCEGAMAIYGTVVTHVRHLTEYISVIFWRCTVPFLSSSVIEWGQPYYAPELINSETGW